MKETIKENIKFKYSFLENLSYGIILFSVLVFLPLFFFMPEIMKNYMSFLSLNIYFSLFLKIIYNHFKSKSIQPILNELGYVKTKIKSDNSYEGFLYTKENNLYEISCTDFFSNQNKLIRIKFDIT